jgi:hypothetical protein
MTFASEMQKNWRAAFPTLLFGEYNLKNNIESDRYGNTTASPTYWSIVEAVYNGTLANIVHGSPMIRCLYANGGASWVTYNTYTTLGAGAATSTAGIPINFGGISALMTKDEDALQQNRSLFLYVPSMTVVPAAGATITQAATGATGIVIASSIVYNYIIVRDLVTGTWNGTAIADSGLTLTPAAPLVRNLVYGTLDINGNFEGNGDGYQAGAGIWIVVSGYSLAWCQGDEAGLGYNGAIADGTPLTWNDNEITLCAANYHDTADLGAVEVPVNGDNIVAYAMQAAAANAANTPELCLVHVRADKPLVYANPALQGTLNEPQA